MNSPERRLTTPRRWSLAAIASGFVLLLISWIWLSVASAHAWTDADAKGYSAASADYHRLTHAPLPTVADATKAKAAPPTTGTADNPLDHAAALAQARARLESDQAALKSAQSAGQFGAAILRGLGTATLLGGIAGWFLAIR